MEPNSCIPNCILTRSQSFCLYEAFSLGIFLFLQPDIIIHHLIYYFQVSFSLPLSFSINCPATSQPWILPVIFLYCSHTRLQYTCWENRAVPWVGATTGPWSALSAWLFMLPSISSAFPRPFLFRVVISVLLCSLKTFTLSLRGPSPILHWKDRKA